MEEEDTMPNNEELAEWVKAQQAQLSEIEKSKGKSTKYNKL